MKKGIYFAFLTAIISGFSVFINKFAVTAIKKPLLFTTIKNFVVAVLIISIIIAFKKITLIKKLKKTAFVYLLLIGVIGGSIPFYLFFTGLSQISAINGALIHKTLVFWVILLAIPFLKEKLSKNQTIAICIIFLSNLIVGGFNGFQFSTGELFVLTATMLWAIENILAKKILPSVDPDIVTASRMGIGGIILFIITLITKPGMISSVVNFNIMQLFWITITSILLFGYVSTWYRALKYAPAIMVATILTSSTLITNILSTFLITHTMTPIVLIQNVGLIIGCCLLFFLSKKSDFSLRPP
jgi:drug/metabolite transporter (DMT)-like permease